MLLHPGGLLPRPRESNRKLGDVAVLPECLGHSAPTGSACGEQGRGHGGDMVEEQRGEGGYQR